MQYVIHGVPLACVLSHSVCLPSSLPARRKTPPHCPAVAPPSPELSRSGCPASSTSPARAPAAWWAATGATWSRAWPRRRVRSVRSVRRGVDVARTWRFSVGAGGWMDLGLAFGIFSGVGGGFGKVAEGIFCARHFFRRHAQISIHLFLRNAFRMPRVHSWFYRYSHHSRHRLP